MPSYPDVKPGAHDSLRRFAVSLAADSTVSPRIRERAHRLLFEPFKKEGAALLLEAGEHIRAGRELAGFSPWETARRLHRAGAPHPLRTMCAWSLFRLAVWIVGGRNG